jgi:hypothetical protein
MVVFNGCYYYRVTRKLAGCLCAFFVIAASPEFEPHLALFSAEQPLDDQSRWGGGAWRRAPSGHEVGRGYVFVGVLLLGLRT